MARLFCVHCGILLEEGKNWDTGVLCNGCISYVSGTSVLFCNRCGSDIKEFRQSVLCPSCREKRWAEIGVNPNRLF